tara:strand:- start:55 stop:708 length:654 start_codon:yes stop_codon:yes gene_type:complete
MKLPTRLITIAAAMNGLNNHDKAQIGTPRNLRGSLNENHAVLESTTLKPLKTGTYVETDRNQDDFKNLGVNLFDNVFIGFLKVNTDGSYSRQMTSGVNLINNTISADSSNKKKSDSWLPFSVVWLYGLAGGLQLLNVLCYCLEDSSESRDEYSPTDTNGDNNNSESGDQSASTSLELTDVSTSINTAELDEAQGGSSNLAADTTVETIAVSENEENL